MKKLIFLTLAILSCESSAQFLEYTTSGSNNNTAAKSRAWVELQTGVVVASGSTLSVTAGVPVLTTGSYAGLYAGLSGTATTISGTLPGAQVSGTVPEATVSGSATQAGTALTSNTSTYSVSSGSSANSGQIVGTVPSAFSLSTFATGTDAASWRTAIGSGTSNLALGSGSTQALAAASGTATDLTVNGTGGYGLTVNADSGALFNGEILGVDINLSGTTGSFIDAYSPVGEFSVSANGTIISTSGSMSLNGFILSAGTSGTMAMTTDLAGYLPTSGTLPIDTQTSGTLPGARVSGTVPYAASATDSTARATASAAKNFIDSADFALITGTTDNSAVLQSILDTAFWTNHRTVLLRRSATVVTDLTTESGTNLITSPSAAFNSTDVGIFVSGSGIYGSGIPVHGAGCYITAVLSGSTATLSRAAVASGTGQRMTIYRQYSFGSTLRWPSGLTIEGENPGSNSPPHPWDGFTYETRLRFSGTGHALNADLSSSSRIRNLALISSGTTSGDGLHIVNTSGTFYSPPGINVSRTPGDALRLDNVWVHGFDNDLYTDGVVSMLAVDSSFTGARTASYNSPWCIGTTFINCNVGGTDLDGQPQAGRTIKIDSGQGQFLMNGGQLHAAMQGAFITNCTATFSGVEVQSQSDAVYITGSATAGYSLVIEKCSFGYGATAGVVARMYGNGDLSLLNNIYGGSPTVIGQHSIGDSSLPARVLPYMHYAGPPSSYTFQVLSASNTVLATYPVGAYDKQTLSEPLFSTYQLPITLGSYSASGSNYQVTTLAGMEVIRANATANPGGYALGACQIYSGLSAGNVAFTPTGQPWSVGWLTALQPQNAYGSFTFGVGDISGTNEGISAAGWAAVLTGTSATLQCSNGAAVTGTTTAITWQDTTMFNNSVVMLKWDGINTLDLYLGKQPGACYLWSRPEKILSLSGTTPVNNVTSKISEKVTLSGSATSSVEMHLIGVQIQNR